LNRLPAILLALCLGPALAFAQNQDEQGLGLDLSGDAAKEQEGSEESLTSETPAEEPPPLPSSETEPPAAEPLSPAARDVTLDDRVKSVQRKVYLKKGRFELAPSVGLSVNDPYYSKVNASVRAAYYLADSLALAVRGSAMQVLPSDDVRTAKRVFNNSQIFFSEPQLAGLADVEWSPLYGKVAFLNSILHFDAYLLGGAGVVFTEASGQDGRGPSFAADVGVGLRFVTRDWLAVNVALINTSFVDQPLGSSKGSMQNVLTLNAGISVFLPLKSTGRDSE
jgi:outer membrane beta-barrel protein